MASRSTEKPREAFRINAPAMAGMEMINENSPANLRLMRSQRAVQMVAPDLEILGIMAMAWAKPIQKESLIVTCEAFFPVDVLTSSSIKFLVE